MAIPDHDGGGSDTGKTPNTHARCSACGARRVHLRVGSVTLECMACGTRTRSSG